MAPVSPFALGGWWGCSSRVAARDLCSGWSAYHMLSYIILYLIIYYNLLRFKFQIVIICFASDTTVFCHLSQYCHHQHCMVTWMSRRAISATSAPLSKSAKESITTWSLVWPLSKANHDLVFLKTTKTDKSSLVDKKRTPSLSPTFTPRPCRPQVRLFPHHFC